MTETTTTEIAATASWTPPRDGVLRDLFLLDVAVAELPGDRWTRELVLEDGQPQAHNVFPTRAAAIRASVAISIREARTQHRKPRDLYDTNPAFEMNADQLCVYVGWLRGVAAKEASRKQAKIESFERGCRRATDWIADREVELGVAGMHPSADGYPKQLAAAWGKYNEFQAALKDLRQLEKAHGPTDVADMLVATGIVPSVDHVRMYGIPRVSPEPEFPSHMYAFPVGYVAGLDDEPDRVFLKDESLRDLPRVRQIEAAVGDRLEVWHPGLPTSFGLSHGRWHHATDLMTDQHYRHLLETRHLTTDDAIDTAVAHGLMHAPFDGKKSKHGGRVSVETARKVLTAVGIPEPKDRSVSKILGDGLHYAEGSKILNPSPGPKGWMLVHMVEDGWTVRSKGFLNLSPKAVEARKAHREKPAVEPAPSAWTPPDWILAGEDEGRPLFAIADQMPDRHAAAWKEDRLLRLRIATATVPPFEACIDLGRNLGAAIQIRATEDGEAWEVSHDCAWGGGSYLAPFRGRYVTRRGAFSVAVKAIRKEAIIPIEAAKVKPPVMCIGAKDTQRANKILAWIDGLVPPGPDEVADELSVHLDRARVAA